MFSCSSIDPIDLSDSDSERQPDPRLKLEIYETFYPSGLIQQRESRKNYGTREGDRKYWYDNGQLWLEEFYQNGVLEGESKSYYRDGTPEQRGHYIQGKLDGIQEEWHPNGKLKSQEYYKYQRREGEQKH
jgi:antitoxin component YwqK of YwqJK toxin-antitoxin module